MNVELSNDARWTATAIGHVLRPDDLDAHARGLDRFREVATQRRPRLVDLPAGLGQEILHECALRRLDVGQPSVEDAALAAP